MEVTGIDNIYKSPKIVNVTQVLTIKPTKSNPKNTKVEYKYSFLMGILFIDIVGILLDINNAITATNKVLMCGLE